MSEKHRIYLNLPDAILAEDAPTLFCFTHAGGGGEKYQSWIGEFSPRIDVRAVTLPGRSALAAQPPITSWSDLIDAVVQRIAPLTDRPFALFGHSLGALVAYETALRLERSGHRPALLAVAGRVPHRQTAVSRISDLADDAFLAAVADMGGTPQEVLSDPSLTQRILPALRADFALLESYPNARAEPLGCPILALGSDRDPQIGFRDIIEWRHLTRTRFDCRVFAGDHFFPFTNPSVPDALFDYFDGALNEQGDRFQQAR